MRLRFGIVVTPIISVSRIPVVDKTTLRPPSALVAVHTEQVPQKSDVTPLLILDLLTCLRIDTVTCACLPVVMIKKIVFTSRALTSTADILRTTRAPPTAPASLETQTHTPAAGSRGTALCVGKSSLW